MDSQLIYYSMMHAIGFMRDRAFRSAAALLCAARADNASDGGSTWPVKLAWHQAGKRGHLAVWCKVHDGMVRCSLTDLVHASAAGDQNVCFFQSIMLPYVVLSVLWFFLLLTRLSDTKLLHRAKLMVQIKHSV